MQHNLLNIFWVDCVQDVEKVLTAWALFFGIIILEENVDIGILLRILPKVLHGQFFVVWDMDVAHIILLKQPLLILEDLPKEILVHLILGWEVVLHCKTVSEKQHYTYIAYPGKRRNPA